MKTPNSVSIRYSESDSQRPKTSYKRIEKISTQPNNFINIT